MNHVTTVKNTTRPEMSIVELLRRSRHNVLDLFPPAMFSQPMPHRRLLFLDSFVLNTPEAIEHVLLTNQQNYVKSQLARRLLGPALGQGLLTSEGALWRRQRRIAAPALQPRRLASSVEIMAACASTLVARWKTYQGPFDICPEMMGVTLDVIARTMFTTDVSADSARIGQLMDTMLFGMRPSALDLLGLPEWLPRPMPKAVKAAIAAFHELVDGIIAARRVDVSDRADLLALLMAARDPETGEAMTSRQLRDEVMTVFLAGHETTANALSFAWWLLAEHPAVEARLHEELDQVLQGRPPCGADLPNLPYTRMVLEEVLRLYPPAYVISRVALQDDVIGGVRIPAGALMTVSPYVTQRNPHLWDDPERFDPERFAPGTGGARHRFAYLPFGAGPRICLGMSFALAEGQMILAAIAQSFRVRLEPGQVVEPVGLVTLRARNGIHVRVEKR